MNASALRLGLGGMLAAACLAVNGCSVATNDDPIRFADPPVWTHEDVGLTNVTGAALRGEAVVLIGVRDVGSRLVVADAETGDERWSIAEDQVLPGGDGLRVDSRLPSPFEGANGNPVVANDGDDWSVIVSYSKVEDEPVGVGEPVEWGVASLSGKDGSMEWAAPLVSRDNGGVDADEVAKVYPVSADGGTVLAVTDGGVQAFALNAGNGKKRWQRQDTWLFAATGKVVLGQEAVSGKNPPWAGEEDSGGDAYAWDAKSGKKKWKAKDTGDHFGLSMVDGSAAVVSDTERGQILDTDTGTKLDDLGEQARDCVADTAKSTGFACSLGSDATIATVSVSDGEATVSENPITEEREEFTIMSMYDGRVFVDSDDTNRIYKDKYILNSDAEIIAKDVPGFPTAMSKEYAIFLSGDDYGESYTKVGLYQVAAR